MTELFINGQKVDLPFGFMRTLTEENPYFGKRGQYTLDIELSMMSPVNAIVFKHYNRQNNTLPIDESMKAVLVIDNRVWLKGTVIILEPSDSQIKFQLVSGNSELNYIAGSSLKIRSLNLGIYTDLSPETFNDRNVALELNKTYPTVKALPLPFLNPDNEEMGNRYHLAVDDTTFKLIYTYGGNHLFKNEDGALSSYVNLRPQPFLCFIIESIITKLGYNLIENQIAMDPVLKNAFLVHGYDTIEWSKMLPNWTVSEFLTQIENFFDCTFIVNNINNQVSIKFNHSYRSNNLQKIDVIKEYAAEIDRSSRLSHKGSNIGFSLDDNDYFKYAVIDKKIKAAAELFDMSSETNKQLVLEALCDMDGLTDNKFSYIFRTAFGDFIAYNNGTKVIAKEVDFLSPVYNNPEGGTNLDIELKIIPAPFKSTQIPLYTAGINPAELTSKYHMQIPIAEHADAFLFNGDSGVPSYNMQNLIDGSDSLRTDYESDKMRIALYDGCKPVRAFTSGGAVISPSLIDQYPVSFIKSLAEYFCDLNTRDFFLADGTKPLSPKWLFDNIYSLDLNVDESKIFKYSFTEAEDLDIKSVFLINNRKYLCSKIERQVTIDGIRNPSTGYFFTYE